MYAMTWLYFQITILNKRNQNPPKSICYIISLTWNSGNLKLIYSDKKQISSWLGSRTGNNGRGGFSRNTVELIRMIDTFTLLIMITVSRVYRYVKLFLNCIFYTDVVYSLSISSQLSYNTRGTSLVAQWLRHCASTTGDVGLIPSWGTTTILHVLSPRK